jgi:SAM-dependent methyltransferase
LIAEKAAIVPPFLSGDSMTAQYDIIGVDYAKLRKPDARIAARIHSALGDARRVLNVGAGAGNYEPLDREVIALEPSAEMIAQRPGGAAPVVQGTAEDLPFADNSFDAAMASLTVHHWTDKAKGLAEMRRVSRGPVVLFTFDPAFRGCWLTDYFPEIITMDDQQMPKMADYENWLGDITVAPVPIPHDCTDGFLYSYWRRPRAYLDPHIRKGISTFWKMEEVETGLKRLADDLDRGSWKARYGHLLELDELDLGYRLVIAG